MTVQTFKPITLPGRINSARQLVLSVPDGLPCGAVTVTISAAGDVPIAGSETLVELLDRMADEASQRGQSDEAVEARIRNERESWN